MLITTLNTTLLPPVTLNLVNLSVKVEMAWWSVDPGRPTQHTDCFSHRRFNRDRFFCWIVSRNENVKQLATLADNGGSRNRTRLNMIHVAADCSTVSQLHRQGWLTIDGNDGTGQPLLFHCKVANKYQLSLRKKVSLSCASHAVLSDALALHTCEQKHQVASHLNEFLERWPINISADVKPVVVCGVDL